MKLKPQRRLKDPKTVGTAETDADPEKLSTEAGKPRDFLGSKLCAELVRKIDFLLSSIKSLVNRS